MHEKTLQQGYFGSYRNLKQSILIRQHSKYTWFKNVILQPNRLIDLVDILSFDIRIHGAKKVDIKKCILLSPCKYKK